MTRSNVTAGSATCTATDRGICVAAYQAVPAADTADTTSIAVIQIAGRRARRAMRVPIAEPIASPLMNAAAIVANA